MNQKCCICQKEFAPNQVIVRIIVEAVSRLDEDGSDPDYWSKTIDWSVLHRVHLTCAASEMNKGFAFVEYGSELNELPLDQLVEDLVEPKTATVIPIRAVQGGS